MIVARKLEKEAEEEPPKPRPLAESLRKISKEARNGNTAKEYQPPLAEVIHLHQAAWAETETDYELIKALRGALSVKAETEYVEVPEPDPTSPALAEGAAPAVEDDRELLDAWLENRTPVGSTKHIHTRPVHLRTEDDYVTDAETGEKYLAPQRLRKERERVHIKTPNGVRKQTVYTLVPDEVVRTWRMVAYRPSQFSDREVLTSVKEYSARNRSPLRGPWNCSAIYIGSTQDVYDVVDKKLVKVGYIPSSYFTDQKAQKSIQKEHTNAQKDSSRVRKRLGKTNAPVFPVLHKSRTTKDVAWLCKYPDRQPSESYDSAYTDPEAVSVNLRNEALAMEVLQQLELADVDLDLMMQESVLFHRNDGTLPPQRPVVDRHISQIEKYFNEYYESDATETNPDTSQSAEEGQVLSPEYEWASTHAANDDIMDDTSIEAVPFTPTKEEPQGFLPAASVPPLVRSMSGWKKDFTPKHVLRTNSDLGAEKGNQSESYSNTVFVRPDGVALKTNHPDSEQARSMVAYAAYAMKHKRIQMPSVASVVRTSETTVLIDGKIFDLTSEEGCSRIKEVVDTFVNTLDELQELELFSLEATGKLPDTQGSLFDWKEMSWNTGGQPEKPKERLEAREKVIPMNRFVRRNDQVEDRAQQKENFLKMVHKGEELRPIALHRAEKCALWHQAWADRKKDAWLKELGFYKRCSERAENRKYKSDPIRGAMIYQGVMERAAEYGMLYQERKPYLVAQEQKRQRERDTVVASETGYLKRLGYRNRKQTLLSIKGIRKKYLKMKLKLKAGLTTRKVKDNHVAATPPTVGEATVAVAPVTEPTKVQPTVSNHKFTYVDPERNDQELAPELCQAIEPEDARRIVQRMRELGRELPPEYLKQEAQKIFKFSVAQKLQRHRERRMDLAAA